MLGVPRGRDRALMMQNPYVRWNALTNSTPDALRILQQCARTTPFLTHLTLRYRVDDRACELMQQLSGAFPLLELHR